eukprot:gene26017-biopygen13006
MFFDVDGYPYSEEEEVQELSGPMTRHRTKQQLRVASSQRKRPTLENDNQINPRLRQNASHNVSWFFPSFFPSLVAASTKTAIGPSFFSTPHS